MLRWITVIDGHLFVLIYVSFPGLVHMTFREKGKERRVERKGKREESTRGRNRDNNFNPSHVDKC